MCGIAGILRFDGGPVDRTALQRMTDSLAHRGPDGEGHYVAGSVGLGHRRLAIIDLSPAGRQPMSNEDGSVWISYNGEVYNFRELRRELEARGHRFRSATDTEVVVHAYQEWGTASLERFNGMFAFALWDARRQRLWLVRDRLGVKPLFYAQRPGALLFGSEIKAVVTDPDVDRDLDLEALGYFLALNHVPAPLTLFSRVRQVRPGHYLLVDASGAVEDVEYWDLVYREGEDRGEAAYRDELSALLADAVRLRLVSDVPFGVFLSGGVDSAAVAYWMSRHLDRPVRTFSIGFEEPSFDERPYAREAAAAIAAEHHEAVVAADVASLLPKLVWHAEEPTADSSMVAVYELAQLARQRVPMVLTGDGADEILAGYETYQAHYLQRAYRRLPAPVRRRLIAPLVRALPVSDGKVSWETRLKRFVAAADLAPEDAHACWRIVFDRAGVRQVLSPELQAAATAGDPVRLYRETFARTNAAHPLNRLLYADTRLYLPSDILVKVDRMTMAHGLEAREPYLDHRLVEFCATVPPRLKLKSLRHKKYLLKAAMRGRLPERLLRRRKQRFNVPNAGWITDGLRAFVLDRLAPSRIASTIRLSGDPDLDGSAACCRTAAACPGVKGRISREIARVKALLDEVSSGHEVSVVRRGQEVARLVPPKRSARRLPPLGSFRASIRVTGGR